MRGLRLAALIGLGVLLTIRPVKSEESSNAKTREVMRFKLYYAQRILEGITMENYDVIAENARKLKNLSQQADWQLRDTPQYQQMTTDFARRAAELEHAANNRNVDAATVAYFEMTVTCTTCHRYLRGSAPAGLQLHDFQQDPPSQR